MGTGLQDKIPLGQATGHAIAHGTLVAIVAADRLLHDGRAKDLNTAIQDHGGEVDPGDQNFNALTPADQADLIVSISSLRRSLSP